MINKNALIILLAACPLGTPAFSQTQQSSPEPSVSASPIAKSASAAAGGAAAVQPRNVWVERFHDAGNTGKIQLGLSIFGLSFAFERFAKLRRARIAPRGLFEKARRLWSEKKFGELETLARDQPSTLARVISFVTQHRNLAVSDVSVTANDIIAREMDSHIQRAYPLGVIASLQPLLGLLGMVLGMIESFERIALAGALGNPAQLAAGISEALTTTALGIALAIPFLSLYHFFKSRTNNYSILLEEDANALIIEWLMKKEA